MRTKRKYKAGKGGKVKKSDKVENIKEGMGGKVKNRADKAENIKRERAAKSS